MPARQNQAVPEGMSGIAIAVTSIYAPTEAFGNLPLAPVYGRKILKVAFIFT